MKWLDSSYYIYDDPISKKSPGQLVHYPTIGYGQRRSHSRHYCVGPQGKHVPMYQSRRVIDRGDNQQTVKYFNPSPLFQNIMQSCHMTDVCFRRDGTLLYIKDEKEHIEDARDLATVMHVQDAWRGPNHLDPRLGHANEGRWLQPELISHEDFEQKYRITWSKDSIAIPYIPSHMKNFGHNLLDTVYSFYRMLRLFDLYDDDANFVPLRMVPSDYDPDFVSGILSKVLDPFLIQNRKPRDSSEFELKNSAGSGHFPTYFDSQTHSSAHKKVQEDCLCFENLLSGRYYHTDHGQDESLHGWEDAFNPFLVGRGDMLRDFRSAYMTRAGLDPLHLVTEKERHANPTSHPSILILPRKSGGGAKHSGTWNHDSLVTYLGDCLRRENIHDTLRVLDVESVSMIHQIHQANSAKVMVSMRGGASLLSLFLPSSASIILLDRDQHRYDDMVYDNIPWLHVQEEPIVVTRNRTTAESSDVENGYNLNSICKKIVNGIQSYELSASFHLGQA
eukprot:scaffold40029_cov58-Attheya_sp.AAC.3